MSMSLAEVRCAIYVFFNLLCSTPTSLTSPHLRGQASRALRQGTSTATSLLQSCMARIRSRDGQLNAFVTVVEEEKLRVEAARADERYLKGKELYFIHPVLANAWAWDSILPLYSSLISIYIILPSTTHHRVSAQCP
jgi:hypothetical protein